MKLVKRCCLLLVLLLPEVKSTQKKPIRNKISKQRLLDEITQKLAKKDVECLNYFTNNSGDTFLFSTPVVQILIDKM